MYYSNLYENAQKSPSTESRSSDGGTSTPATPTGDFVYPSNHHYLSYKYTNPPRRTHAPSDDIPPVPEMPHMSHEALPPIEALDLSTIGIVTTSGTGNTATTATAPNGNITLSKRRSQAHMNRDYSGSGRDSNSSGSASSRPPMPTQPLYFDERNAAPSRMASQRSTSGNSRAPDFPTTLAEHTDRSERRWKQPPPGVRAGHAGPPTHTGHMSGSQIPPPIQPLQVTTSYSRLSPPSQGPASPTGLAPQASSPNFSSSLMHTIVKKSKPPILPMGTTKKSVFWQQQEARDKLRMLCAPQEDAENATAFDEIVEFGFPVDFKTSNEDIGFGARQMTLHVTLSPAAMRDEDEVLYGWQRELAPNNNSNPTVDDISSVQYQQHMSYDDPNEKVRGQPLLSGSTSSGGGMKRVFGKLKKKAPANSSIMITSADVQ